MFKLIVFLTVCTFFTNGQSSEPDESAWHKFKLDHNKSYAKLTDEDYRRQTFLANLARIKIHNERAEKGLETYKLGINRFADMEFHEFASKYLNYKSSHKKPSSFLHYKLKSKTLPQSLDWRQKGIVNHVKDQGECGSCWAFSAAASLESGHAQKTGKLVSLSEQNLIDCSWPQGNEGCNGGVMEYAFDYVLSNNGLDTESSYPYEEKDGSCRFNKSNVGANMESYVDIPVRDEDALLDAASGRVVSVALEAGLSLQLYSGGLYDDFLCSGRASALNHAVVVVGFGHNSTLGKDYWILKNSWGESWGEGGFARFRRGKNRCGIALQASYPLV